MPHLRYCNRYWYISGDELSCPAFCSLLSRLVWAALISAVFGVAYNNLEDCNKGWLLETYLLLSILVFVADIIVDGLIIYVSLQGSITAMSDRKQLGSLLTARIGLIAMQTACSIFGIIAIIAHSGVPCNREFDNSGLRRIFIAVVAASQLFDSIVFICCGSCLIRSSSSADESPNEVMEDEMEAWVAWSNRCQQLTRSIRFLSCGLFGGGQINEGFEEVAKALVQFFHHSGFLDVVASDVVAGFVLVRLEQRQHRKHTSEASHKLAASRASVESPHDDQRSLLVDSSRLSLMRVSSGSTFSQRISRGSRTSSSSQSAQIPITGDVEMALSLPSSSNQASHSQYHPSNFPTLPVPTPPPHHPPSASSSAASASSILPPPLPPQSTHDSFYDGHHGVSSLAAHPREPRITLNALAQSSTEEEGHWLRGSIYALAMYTHLMALYVHPCSGLCRLLCSLRCCLCRHGQTLCMHTSQTCYRSPSSSSIPSSHSAPSSVTTSAVNFTPRVLGDNCCGLHYVGMNIFTNLIEAGTSELLHVSYVNDTYMKPFGIFLDHANQWLVISIRGTLSLEDCITDATFEPWELTQVGNKWGFDGRGQWGHSGMVRAADRIREELEQVDVLKRIFHGRTSSSSPNITTPLHDEWTRYSNYRVTVIGHSLGAGAAVLLAMMLRPTYPTVQCFAYGTPASVLDANTCREVSSFVTSIVLDNDLVSRLSFRSLCTLRNRVLDAISRARVNKVLILKALFQDIDPSEFMHPVGQEPDSDFKRQVKQFQDTLQERLDKLEHELFLPGRIIHLTRISKAKGTFRSRFVYDAFERDLEYFTEIAVSSTMVADHLPDRYYDELMRLRR